MDDLSELYQEVILDHNKRPRNFQVPDGANRRADGHNPLCGDQLTLYVLLDGDTIRDIGFQGAGCAISKASASLMTDILKGKTIQDAESLFGQFHTLITNPMDPALDPETLGKLAVFSGVSEYPMRVKCASLAWHTLRAALRDETAPVTTE